MLLLVSQKRLRDKYGQPVDGLETALTECLASLFPGAALVPVPNHPANAGRLVGRLSPDMVVLSGGNDVGTGLSGEGPLPSNLSPERDRTEEVLVAAATARGAPILGICRGMQFLNVLLGGGLSLSRPGHPAGRLHSCDCLGQSHTVNSFHDYAVRHEDLAPGMEPLAMAGDVVEAFAGRQGESRILAVQWHPERPDGNTGLLRRLIENHLALAAGSVCAR